MSDETPPPAPRERSSNDVGFAARMGARVRSAKDKLKTANTRATELETENARLKAENERLSKTADTSASGKRVVELERQLRERDLKATFGRLAKDAGATDDDAVDDLWDLSRIDASDDSIDEHSMREVIEAHKTKRARFFSSGESTAETEAHAEPAKSAASQIVERKPGPGAGRRERAAVDGGAPRVSEDLVKNDPIYVMKNWGRVTAAAKAKVGF